MACAVADVSSMACCRRRSGRTAYLKLCTSCKHSHSLLTVLTGRGSREQLQQAGQRQVSGLALDARREPLDGLPPIPLVGRNMHGQRDESQAQLAARGRGAPVKGVGQMLQQQVSCGQEHAQPAR
eukprot:1160897-Pelagomonas_calceolata.AAC.3